LKNIFQFQSDTDYFKKNTTKAMGMGMEMNEQVAIFSLAEIKDLPDAELYQLLYKSWNITNEKIEVWGCVRLNPDRGLFRLYEVKSLVDNSIYSYPYKAQYDLNSGVHISLYYANTILNGQSSAWIKCELELSIPIERERYLNPFLLQIKEKSAVRLVSMPNFDIKNIITGSESSYISEEIYNFHHDLLSNNLADEKLSIEMEIKTVEDKREKLGDILEEMTKKKNELEADHTLLKSSINTRQDELIELNQKYQAAGEDMSRKIEKLRAYISEKATFLKDFEFIDEDDFDEFLTNSKNIIDTAKTLSFVDALNGDYKQAVSYIQAYLKNRDILYPRHIIENYLTLIRSNDLIILAGDSGSGKTNLVNSFAKAIGGVSKIIPVKPNWTSSEDLLGYYNPLEKKYLATPFLEALIEAIQNPDVPYFICLDEMNLARIEYYFADFLSKLETRDSIPEIQLYSDDESAHVLSELKAVISIISNAKDKFSKEGIVDFVKLMQDESINAEMKRAFGFSDKDSLIKYHGDIRRMLAGVMGTPSTIKIPNNVRIIGAINIDETTHYLSPKILDRAHIMKFNSPLLADWDSIFSEIETYGFENVDSPLHFEIDALGVRRNYPKYERDDDFCQLFVKLNKEFFSPLGVEFGMRTIRQGLQYLHLFSDINEDRELAINNFILHKVLPKFTFDGTKQSGNYNKLDLIDKVLVSRLEDVVKKHGAISEEFSCVAALKNMVKNAKTNDGIVNYWA
jgi:energy-coupling factor transporter ATP-binding protein EcfA2